LLANPVALAITGTTASAMGDQMGQTSDAVVAPSDGRIRLDSYIIEWAARLSRPQPSGAESAIEEALSDLLPLVRADGGVLIGVGGQGLAWVTCASDAEGIAGRLARADLPSVFPWHVEHWRQASQAIAISRRQDFPAPAAVDQRSAADLGIEAMLTTAVVQGESGAHVLLLVRRRAGAWPAHLATSLHVLVDIFGAALERQRAEDTRQQLSRRPPDLLSSVRAIIWRADPRTFQTTFVSKEAESILGYPLESWLKIPGFWTSRLHPDDRDWVLALSAKATMECRAHDFEYRMIVADGQTVWLRNIVNVLAENGVPKEVVGVTVDITRRKITEIELERLRLQLAHTHRVATLGELAAALAHELNQPLGAILSNAETASLLCRNSPPSPELLSTILDDIVRDGHRAGSVLHRLRTFLQPHPLVLEPLDVARLVAEVVGLVRVESITRQVEISVEVPPDLGHPFGDAVQIQQVLLNLILNAMDAVDDQPASRRRIRIAAVPRSPSIEISVADRGGGFPTETLPRAFDPFVTTKATGLGIGLSICRSIIRAHGGEITVENNADGGATARVTLPEAAPGSHRR
jgi:PAS domain S-box-containing protein